MINMVIYSITNQTDLELLPNLTSYDTVRLMNDITLANWSPLGITISGATIDGQNYSISGLTTLSGNAIKEGNATGYGTIVNIGSGYNIGTVHTIAWTAQIQTGTTYSFYMFGSGNESYGSIRMQNNNSIVYRCGNGTSSVNQAWINLPSFTNKNYFTLIRNGTSITLYVNGTSYGAKTLSANYDFTRFDEICRSASGTWGGIFNEIVVTNDVKDSNWVALYYNAGLGRYITTSNTSNIINLWHCDEGSGTTIADSVGSNNGSGVDGWGNFVTKGGFVETMTNGYVNNLILINPSVTWNLTDTSSSTLYLGGIVNNPSGTVFNKCEVRGGTLSAPNVKYINMGGIAGNGLNVVLNNCISSVDNFVWTDIGLNYSPQVGGIIGRGYNSTMSNCYFSGGGTNPPSVGLTMHNTTGNRYYNNFVTGTTLYLRLAGLVSGAPPSWETNYYLDQSSQSPDTMTGVEPIMKSDISWFYDISNAPMNQWDFSGTGAWSKSQNTTTFPPLKTNYSDDISGTVTGWTSGKTVKLVTKSKSKVPTYKNTIGTLSSYIDLGGNFTVSAIIVDRGIGGQIWGLLYHDVNNFITFDGSTNASSIRIRCQSTDMYSSYAYNMTGRHWVVISKASGSPVRIFFDGTECTYMTNPANTKVFNHIDYIGKQYSGDAPNGGIAEVVMLNYAVDETWVTDKWANGEIKKIDSSEPGIIEGFHMDEGTGNVCSSFVTARTLTINPTPYWSLDSGYGIRDTITATTTSSGDFTLSSVDKIVGTPVLIYIEDGTVNGSIVATIPDGLMGEVTGLALAQDTVQIGDSKLNDAMTSSLLDSASLYDFADNNFRVSSGVVYYNNGCDLKLPTGCSYTGIFKEDTGETGKIIIDGTATLTANAGILGLDVTGNCNITTGTLNGSVNNSGTFLADTVQLQIYSPTIANTGNMTLRGMFKADTEFFGDIHFTSVNFTTAGTTYTFENGKIYTYDSLTANGVIGNEITFQSDSAGNRFTLDGPGANLSFMKVKDSQCSTASIYASRSINLGGNDDRESLPKWIFLANISGFIIEHS